MDTSEAIHLCKEILTLHYGEQFQGLVLYGSLARGQADPESDIDLLVLLRSPFDYLAELRRIVDLLYPVQLQTMRLVSALPAPLGDFERGSLQFYRNARRDGIKV